METTPQITTYQPGKPLYFRPEVSLYTGYLHVNLGRVYLHAQFERHLTRLKFVGQPPQSVQSSTGDDWREYTRSSSGASGPPPKTIYFGQPQVESHYLPIR